jgi:glyoxylase-like metal-dependent hydrolase (beta-lactamase superfamily II)
MHRIAVLLFLTLLLAQPVLAQNSYRIEEVDDGIYAALAEPGSAATSNAFIVDLGTQMVVCGAHFSRRAINDLIAATSEISPKPIRAFVLAHHHPGYTFIDFDIPANKDLAMSIETRLIMRQEPRALENPLLFFKEGLTFEGTQRTLILTNIGSAHSEGDLIAYVPQSKILFTSDLAYFNSVGFLGAGSLTGWATALEGLGALQVKKVVPGFGPVGDMNNLNTFKRYLKDFLTEVLEHIEKGDNLETTLATFSLPKHDHLSGYQSFTPGNVERAYQQLKKYR